ncbi:hypothetical protein K439DRAFT_1632330 [Ramaria rubella]|nr:hypothetical protein K439DRAFT_1632330 [Ramaria rubella]
MASNRRHCLLRVPSVERTLSYAHSHLSTPVLTVVPMVLCFVFVVFVLLIARILASSRTPPSSRCGFTLRERMVLELEGTFEFYPYSTGHILSLGLRYGREGPHSFTCDDEAHRHTYPSPHPILPLPPTRIPKSS